MFGSDENEIIIIDKSLEITKFEKAKKYDLAKRNY